MHEPTSSPPTPGSVGSAVTAALSGVIDPCCRDRGISVVDMGLVSEVHVDPDGHAAIDILLTSGWCPFQVDLTAEVTAAAETVPGVRTAEVRIRVDRTWSPDRMSPSARQRLRLLPEPGEVGDRDRYLAANPLPIAHVG
ncbi:metal-sulfur cluster assembly factor [Euzebya rosea]|uniref:metal-sulfur cluster assembly factor n=1 Tax=Euzebya rosea TaxID=2052804 RepID=UPI000D3E83DF|nr:metal-sulfur cluster assembly factor [Euzebya rosea]